MDSLLTVRFDSIEKLNKEIELFKKESNYETKEVSPVETLLRKTNEVLVFDKKSLTMDIFVR